MQIKTPPPGGLFHQTGTHRRPILPCNQRVQAQSTALVNSKNIASTCKEHIEFYHYRGRAWLGCRRAWMTDAGREHESFLGSLSAALSVEELDSRRERSGRQKSRMDRAGGKAAHRKGAAMRSALSRSRIAHTQRRRRKTSGKWAAKVANLQQCQ